MNKVSAKINQPIVRSAQVSIPVTSMKAEVNGETKLAGETSTPPAPAPALSEATREVLPEDMFEGTNTNLDIRDTYITIVGDTVNSAHIIGMWDTALTVCGALVFTPPTVELKADPSELELGDFAVNVKIRKSQYLIVVVSENGEIPSYMFPWIDFAYSRGKTVIFDQPTIPSTDTVTFRTNGLIRELRGYKVEREGFLAYTKGKLD